MMSTCSARTDYPIIVQLGEMCQCERRNGHSGRHLGKGRDGKYFSWELGDVQGCILEDEVPEEDAKKILKADRDEEVESLVAAE